MVYCRNLIARFAPACIALSIFSTLCINAEEILPLTQTEDAWETSPATLTAAFSSFHFIEKDGTYISKEKSTTLWNKSVHSVAVSGTNLITNSINIELADPITLNAQTKQQHKEEFESWIEIIEKSTTKKTKRLPTLLYGTNKHSRYGWSLGDTIIILSYIDAGNAFEMQLRFAELNYGIQIAKLKGQQDVSFLSNKHSTKVEKSNSGAIPSGHLDSKKVLDKLKLNVYRFLCGVSYHVKPSKALNQKAEDAAQACMDNGELSHSIGSYTDVSNLAMNSGGIDFEVSLFQYINDDGENNRAKRGHRAWCLNPTMGITGFGVKDVFSAMYVADMSGDKFTHHDFHSYPGEGLYPIKYLHGNGWSFYSHGGALDKKTKVEVWRLTTTSTSDLKTSSSASQQPSWDKSPKGTKLPTKYVNVVGNYIVFEPKLEPITETGTYLIRVSSNNYKKQYSVTLY